MRILDLRILAGPNLFSRRPVVEMTLDLGRWAGRESHSFPGLVERLPEVLPGLAEHHCSLGHPGGFLERLSEGTYLGHTVEHVALELLTLAGEEAVYGQTRTIDGDRLYRVVYEYEGPETGRLAGKVAVRLVGELARGRTLEGEAFREAFLQRAARVALGPSARAIYRAARSREIPARALEGGIIELGSGQHRRRVASTLTDLDSAVAVDLVGDKELTRRLLDEAGLPVAAGALVRRESEALERFGELGTTVAVKPNRGHQGQGVTLDVGDEEELGRAFHAARRYGPGVLLEAMVTGQALRALIVDGRLVAAARRFPPQVIADGRRSVAELVAAANRDPRRGFGHERPLTRIRLDASAQADLAAQGFELASVPPAGLTVRLGGAANLSAGGSAQDVTDRVGPELRILCERVARTAGLKVAGVDLVAPDLDSAAGATILEVNAAPGIRMHHFPGLGEARDAAGAIVDALFPPGSPNRIPVAAITGTNGKTTVARLVKHLVQSEGRAVGLATTDGLFLNDQRLASGDTTGPRSAQAILSDPAVEVAVLETARGGICRGGLGFDRCTVGAVLNLTGDHLGQDGIESLEDLAAVKSLVVEASDGWAVLNADDPLVLAMAERSRVPLILFSQAADNLAVLRHRADGGRAVFVRRGIVRLAEGEREERLLPLRQVPLTMGGQAPPMVQNAVAATAIAWGLGLQPAAIARGLGSFPGGPEANPGRLNLLEVGGIRVLIDYGHNAAAFEAVLRTSKAWRPRHRIGVIGLPGDRRDEDALNLGRIAARGFDYLFIKEDQDLRGRRPGEVAELLRQGALGARRSPSRIQVILPEGEATRAALELAKPGDLVVVFFEDLETVQTAVAEYSGRVGVPSAEEIS